MFDIRQHVDLGPKGRAQCPSCLLDGKTSQNLAVVIEGSKAGAYKCHRGCTPQQIRAALGDHGNRTLPKASNPPSPPPKGVVIDAKKVDQAHYTLMNTENPARRWLNARGLTDEMLNHYRLGQVRSKCGDSSKTSGSTFLPAIAIPISTADGEGYFHKKRVRPWVDKADQPDGYKKWSQYGIPAMVFTTNAPSKPRETWLCEGEWDAIMLGWAVRNSFFRNEVQVSCFTCGCDNVPPDEALSQLKGDEVIVFYDRDEAGEHGALKVQSRLTSRCRRGQVPANGEPPTGYDVSDALNAGIPLERFAAAAAASVVWQRPPDNNPLRERMVSNDDMLARAAEYTDWLVDEILTADELFLLAASPRAGKSLMAFTLSLAIATGGKFLGRPCAKGAVIYIRCEDSETKAKERELKQGWGEGLPVYWLDKFKLSELPHLEQLVEEVGARLVVFDTLSRIRDAGISESSAEMSQLLEPVQEMCKRQRCAGLLVHHTGKVNLQNAGDIDIFDTIRGSSAIRATCRGTLIIAAGEQNYRLAVENGWGKLDLQILLDANTLNWKLLGNWNGPSVEASQKDRVLNYLSQVGSAGIDDIAEATNLPKRSLYEVLKRLQCDEQVEKQGERKSAVYVKTAIQQIQQLNSLLNSSNVDTEDISSPIQQELTQGDPPEKVINAEESDQKNDHFLGSPPTPHTCKTVELNTETHAGQGVPNSTPNSTQFNSSTKSDQEWLFWEKKDLLVKVIRKAKKTHLVRVSGSQRDERVPVEELVEPPADRFNV